MEFKTTQLELNISDALSSMPEDMLPESLLQYHEVIWIMDFLKEKSNDRDDRQYAEGDMINEWAENIIGRDIEFYFASLSHIGRIIKVSQLVLSDIEQGLSEGNLRQTIDNNDNLKLRPEIFRKALQEILETARKVHYRKSSTANEWFYTWRKEVAQLIEKIEKCNYEIRDIQQGYRPDRQSIEYLVYPLLPLAEFSYESLELNNLLIKDGVSIQVNKESHKKSSTFMRFLFMNAESNNQFGELIRLSIQEKQAEINLIREKQLMPFMNKVLDELQANFEGENLFKKYMPGVQAADQSLLELFNRCRLPNGKLFYLAKNWLDNLLPKISNWSPLLIPPEFTEEDLSIFIKAADSSIKRAYIEKTDSLQRQSLIIQEIFENEWIRPLAIIANDNDSKFKVVFGDFVSSINVVVKGLNRIGYNNIKVPEKSRLELLWKSIANQKYWDAW